MSKTPIEPADIRKGDLIRFEYADTDSAHEYRADCGGEEWSYCSGQHYLLDRPNRTLVDIQAHLAACSELIAGILGVAD